MSKENTEAEKEFLDMTELLTRVPYGERTIERFIAEGKLIYGVHFRRPGGPGTKRIFFWSAIVHWLHGEDFELRRRKLQQQQDREK